ncbi:MAG TPA: ABC transporter ATP-binding protein [Nitrospinae bacterium]|nr:ABC transporter ATP-binding protein [Nitrospinota bacterium]
MSEAVLEGRGITKRFGGLTAVSAVDFTLRKGEILGLIGPNGAGKTTLLNCITGFDSPDEGEVLLQGERIETLKPHAITRKGIARTFQIVQPFPSLTVLDNVTMGALFGAHKKGQEVARAREAAKDKLEMVGLIEKADHLASELTLAERKRLELAKSLATEPEILLLDEVNAGLNPTEIQVAISLIQKIREGGVTILVIEHLMKVIMGLSDRVIVLHHGEKIAEGPPREVTSDERVIKAYLGDKYAAMMDKMS